MQLHIDTSAGLRVVLLLYAGVNKNNNYKATNPTTRLQRAQYPNPISGVIIYHVSTARARHPLATQAARQFCRPGYYTGIP